MEKRKLEERGNGHHEFYYLEFYDKNSKQRGRAITKP